MKKILRTLVFLVVSTQVHAAGYLEFDANGTPYKWDRVAHDYKIDLGDLGTYPKGGVNGSDDLVDEAFQVWGGLGTGLTFASAGATAADITFQNLGSFVNFNGTSCPTQDFVVVYDDSTAAAEDQIFSQLFPGQSDSILGFASPSVLSDTTKKITCGYAFINGNAVTTILQDRDNLLYTLMHELGHAQNLEHSQIHEDLLRNDITADDEFIPLMFPFIPSNISEAIGGGLNGLKVDDQFSFRYLYDQTTLNTQGKIAGKILDKAGTGVLGVNVVCYDKSNPDENVVSWISDANLDGDGEYECGGLPAGSYQVKIEPIKFAINVWDDTLPPNIPTEFYNGENESFNAETDNLEDKTDVAVSAASTMSDIDVILNNNGQITSEKKVTGTIEGSVTSLSVADLEYYIYVPKSVTKATFTLTSNPTSSDVDIYGRCDSPFSLSSIAPDIYNPASADQQADFAGAGDTGDETVVLDSDSTPEIDNCEYHLLLANYDESSASFELTATLEGPQPELKANFIPTKKVQSNGETLVSTVVFEAADDQFTINSATFTDAGTLTISGVTSASIYYDENENGKVDSTELPLSTTTSIDSSQRTIAFSNLDIFLDEGRQKSFLLTYAMPSQSSMPVSLIILILGAMFFVIRSRNTTSIAMTLVLFSIVFMNRCSSSSADYDPRIQTSDDISAEASGFGSQYTVQVGTPDSVKDFFE